MGGRLMGPFDGAGVSLIGIAIFGLIAILVAVFNAGRRSAAKTQAVTETKTVNSAAPPPGMEHFLACDACARETERLLRRGNGPELCEECFKKQPIDLDTSSRDKDTSGKSANSG